MSIKSTLIPFTPQLALHIWSLLCSPSSFVIFIIFLQQRSCTKVKCLLFLLNSKMACLPLLKFVLGGMSREMCVSYVFSGAPLNSWFANIILLSLTTSTQMSSELKDSKEVLEFSKSDALMPLQLK